MSEPEIVMDLKNTQALFVQTARSADHVDGRIATNAVRSSTLHCHVRPSRVVGRIGTPEFVKIWTVGENNFAEDLPNVAFAFIPHGRGEPRDVVVEIRDLAIDGLDLSRALTALERSRDERAAGCTIFIDPFGRPLSPVSFAGMHRRNRRSDRRLSRPSSTRGRSTIRPHHGGATKPARPYDLPHSLDNDL